MGVLLCEHLEYLCLHVQCRGTFECHRILTSHLSQVLRPCRPGLCSAGEGEFNLASLRCQMMFLRGAFDKFECKWQPLIGFSHGFASCIPPFYPLGARLPLQHRVLQCHPLTPPFSFTPSSLQAQQEVPPPGVMGYGQAQQFADGASGMSSFCLKVPCLQNSQDVLYGIH